MDKYLERLLLAAKALLGDFIKRDKRKIDGGEGVELKPEYERKTPPFLQQIKKKKTKRLSPY